MECYFSWSKFILWIILSIIIYYSLKFRLGIAIWQADDKLKKKRWKERIMKKEKENGNGKR